MKNILLFFALSSSIILYGQNEVYEKNKKVWHISAWNYNFKFGDQFDDAFFNNKFSSIDRPLVIL